MNPALLSLTLHLRLVGGSLLVLALLHAFFSKPFRWREELDRLSLLNRQIFYVHTYFVVLTVILFGLLSFVWPETLLDSSLLARLVCAGQAIFWGFRLYCQFAVYHPELWRGKPFQTIVHVFFSLLWAYYTLVYVAACFAASQYSLRGSLP